MMDIPVELKSTSSDCACLRTFGGRMAGPGLKLCILKTSKIPKLAHGG